MRNDVQQAVGGLIPVALTHCAEYEYKTVHKAVRDCLQAINFAPATGAKVLVKPNLLKADSNGLCCTHPAVVEAVCEVLLEHGCAVTVGDSPVLGSAVSVARSIGLFERLERFNVPIITLDSPKCVTFESGSSIGISRSALECDLLLNIPRMKAHCQMRTTFAVKNLFGCVSGVRKAIAHSKHGDKANAFRELLVDVALALPECVSVVDGITCMHKTGPIFGVPYSLGLIGAAGDPVSLDTALYSILNCSVEEMPLWKELQRKNVRGAFEEHLEYVLATPQEFNAEGFMLPVELTPETFHPVRLLQSSLKRLWKRYICP
ncbi:DUF362 domain-containing protein [Halodesulfovibrio marinisediminis]|uniref:Uncharacterized conserved protein, DUF362 family n=1 Tax=Halodesulfovibrio marinisediminis DSM 17456 TaxID=1121457 RepID=A0A1N6FNT2_9BACT|nr:DUF362 domain-containing protein [Halodesulfovibrio marinisediminis]SIN96969.1 Uncharacterized conserved protein, DUF362 family [Halodesulfovibrio marinisediminis DSM 17456]